MEDNIKRIKRKIILYKVISKLSNMIILSYTLFTMCSIYYAKGYNYIASINSNIQAIESNETALYTTLILVLILMISIKCFSLLVITKLNNSLKILKEKNSKCKRKQKTY